VECGSVCSRRSGTAGRWGAQSSACTIASRFSLFTYGRWLVGSSRKTFSRQTGGACMRGRNTQSLERLRNSFSPMQPLARGKTGSGWIQFVSQRGTSGIVSPRNVWSGVGRECAIRDSPRRMQRAAQGVGGGALSGVSLECGCSALALPVR
jgi:hypothetical protein